MLDRLRDYTKCLAEPRRWAIATIIESSGSVPRPVGTSMAIRDDMTTIGSVSGGCVEAALVETARQCLEQDVSAVERFGYADDDAIAIGLMCGGEITVLVQPVAHMAAPLQDLQDRVTVPGPARSRTEGGLVRALPQSDDHARRPGQDRVEPGAIPAAVAVGTAQHVTGQDVTGQDVIGQGAADEAALHRMYGHAATQILSVIAAGRCAVVDVRDEEDPACPIIGQVFVESPRQRSRVLIYGASDYSAAIADAARMLGRHVTVCDARAVFATAERHPSADEVAVRIPAEHFREQWDAGQIDERTAVLVMTHDTRFDIPLLQEALRCDLGYIGALGSRTTNERRLRDLAERGLAEQAERRLHAPVGLDIGARTPHEVAISVFAEIIAEENGRAERVGPVGQLRFGDGPIHAYGPLGAA